MKNNIGPSPAAEMDDPLAGDIDLEPPDADRVKGGGTTTSNMCRTCGHSISSGVHTFSGSYYTCKFPYPHRCAL